MERGKARGGEGREKEGKSRSVGRLVGRWFWFVAADADAVASLCILVLPFRLQSLILILFFRKTDCCTVRGNTASPPLAQYHTKARTGLAASQISQPAHSQYGSHMGCPIPSRSPSLPLEALPWRSNHPFPPISPTSTRLMLLP
jgi:hypothetical protein